MRTKMVFVVLGLASCSHPGRPRSSVFSYHIHTPGFAPGSNARLLLGTIALPIKGDVVTLQVARDAPPALTDPKLELPTPCGTKQVPVTISKYLAPDVVTADVEKQLREQAPGAVVEFSLVRTGLPKQATFYTDTKSAAKLGEVELGNQRSVFDYDCGAAVTFADGTSAPLPSAASPHLKSFFVTDDKTACYEETLLGYGALETSSKTVLRGANVYSTHSIDFLLKPAPQSVLVDKGVKQTGRSQLLKVPCPA